MKIDKGKLDIILAKKCMSLTDLRGKLSAGTLTRIRSAEVTTKTVGKLAAALGVDPAEIIEGGK